MVAKLYVHTPSVDLYPGLQPALVLQTTKAWVEARVQILAG